MRRIVSPSIFLICLCAAAFVSYAQQICKYYTGCSVEPFYGCEVRLLRTSCNDSSTWIGVRCTDLSPYCISASSCSCHCNNYADGDHGVIDYYDNCSNSLVQSKYECSGCPTATPTPTPPPSTPCSDFGQSCTSTPDCC